MTSSGSQAPGAPAPPAVLRPGLPLTVIVAMACLAQFMVVLDSAIVTLALPQMRQGLGLSTGEQQWVLSGYLITLGGFLLLCARAGDLFGRKRLFLFGAAVFTAASLAGGLATDPAMLLAARVIQGAGAAALAPTSLSLITATHADEQRRRRALTLWSIMGGLAGVAGIILGGVLTAELNWRWVLFINVPLGIALLAATLVALLPAPARSPAAAPVARVRLDVAGALTATLGIGALTYGLSQASASGWGSASVVAGLACAAALLLAFVVVEATGSQPLIPPALFRLRGLSVGNLLMLGMGATMTAAFFFLSLYLQEALGYSALRAGLAMLPTTVVMVAAGLVSSRLIPVAGPRLILLAGGLITAAALAWLTTLPGHPAYLAHVLGPALLAGAGMGLMLLPTTLSGTNGVPVKDAGAAAGLLNSARQVGGALGLAALVNIAATATRNDVARAGQLGGLVHGYHVAFGVDAAIMVAAGLLALALPASRHHPTGITLNAFRLNTAVNHAMFAGRRGRVYDRLVALSGVRPGDTVLDVGSSSGYLTRRMAAVAGQSGHVVGVDPAGPAIAYARRRALPGLTFTVGVAQDLALPDDSFDVVTCTLAMHHIPASDRPAAFAQMYRVTKPGGRLLVADIQPLLAMSLAGLARTAGYVVESTGQLPLLRYVLAVRPRTPAG